MAMAYLFLLVVCYTATVAVSVGEYSISILTDPSQGPFRFEQIVRFSCLVEPTPPSCDGPVTYQWRSVQGDRSSEQSFNKSYYDGSPHYCYYFCEVSVDGTLLGSASRVVEVMGYLYTEEPVVRSFTRSGSLVLAVNMSDSYNARHINSLMWYHNGTEIVSGNKYSISSNINGTMLKIINMTKSDAGKYEAKIGSISYYGRTSSSYCNSLVLPLLELSAAHAPVTFTVQEGRVPTYDPSSIISTLYVTDSVDGSVSRLELRVAEQYNSSFSPYHRWYRNGIQLSDRRMYNSSAFLQEGLSLQILYNNTADDVIGDYVGVLEGPYYYFKGLVSMCSNYRTYFDNNFSVYFTFTTSFWRIRIKPQVPSSVILTVLETTAVECSVVGGGPVDTFNLTLWRNEELVARVNGRQLSHMTTPSQYGTYRCSVGDLHNTTVLMERDLVVQDVQTVTSSTIVGFFAGVAAGILITVMVIAVIICVQKARALASTSQPPGSAKVPMATNKAYESVDPHYETVGAGEEQEEGEGTY